MASEGPDFICVGMPKAGTGWLYDQLVEHPDFWMPPFKEVRYLDNEIPDMWRATNRLDRKSKRGGEKGERKARDERDRGFMERASALSGLPMDIRGYIGMFNVKGGSLAGDVTPSYATLTEDVIAQIAEHLPQVKIILLVRDPVSRTWSHAWMKHRVGKLDEDLLDNPERFRAFLDRSRNVEERSQPTKIIERWARVAPEVSFRHFFFDDLVQRPDWLRREILAYLGGDPEKESVLAAGYNRKGAAPKRELPPAIQAEIVEHLRDELCACAEQLGGHARRWAEKYGVVTTQGADV